MSWTYLIQPFLLLGFPGSSVGKESACNTGDLGSIPGSVTCMDHIVGCAKRTVETAMRIILVWLEWIDAEGQGAQILTPSHPYPWFTFWGLFLTYQKGTWQKPKWRINHHNYTCSSICSSSSVLLLVEIWKLVTKLSPNDIYPEWLLSLPLQLRDAAQGVCICQNSGFLVSRYSLIQRMYVDVSGNSN